MSESPNDRPTLEQILSHPWMLKYRRWVSRYSCESSQYALRVSSDGALPSPLASSVTVSSELCDLASGSGSSGSGGHVVQTDAPVDIASAETTLEAAESQDGVDEMQENTDVSPDLLPVQSAESVSAMLTHDRQVHRSPVTESHPASCPGFANPLPASFRTESPQQSASLFTGSPQSSNGNGNGNGNGQGCYLTFRRNSVFINPPPENNYLHPYDTRHPSAPSNPEEMFARLMEQEDLISGTVDDFELLEDVSESHSSSGFFSRTDSMNEDYPSPVTTLGSRVSEILEVSGGKSCVPLFNGNRHGNEHLDPLHRAFSYVRHVLRMGC